MSAPLRYTLVGDGPSDRCLLPIINWALGQIEGVREFGFIPQVADPRDPQAAGSGLAERVRQAVRVNPCDLLFIHRDAEKEPLEKRVAEIRQASRGELPPHVPVVPVRMTEAWLLIEEKAIRSAADNPNGEAPLPLPLIRRLESIADPKRALRECLLSASGKKGRRLDQFRRDLPGRVYRVAELIEDFTPLRSLSAFRRFEEAVRTAVSPRP